jgi:hypothetical protein
MEPLKTTPKDVFLQLLMMVMLYICVISFITISFSYIDYWHPDPLNYYLQGTLDSIKHASSMLIVSFPLMLLLGWFIQKDFRKNPGKHELKFRKWLVYLTLFVSAITIVVDLIQLVYRFYGGDLTLTFSLKVLSVLILTGAVFGYYVWDVQSEPHKSKVPNRVAWTSSIAVVAMIVLGFIVVGSPTKQRQLRMDEQRVNDLSMLQGEIINYWTLKDTLPTSLNDLKNDLRGFIPPVDPETQAPYEYTAVEPLKFKLCATFTLPSQNSNIDGKTVPVATPYYYGGYPASGDLWTHDTGLKCFERTIDPSLYPKPVKQ